MPSHYTQYQHLWSSKIKRMTTGFGPEPSGVARLAKRTGEGRIGLLSGPFHGLNIKSRCLRARVSATIEKPFLVGC